MLLSVTVRIQCSTTTLHAQRYELMFATVARCCITALTMRVLLAGAVELVVSIAGQNSMGRIRHEHEGVDQL